MHPACTHIALHVADVEASVHFYTSFCRLKVVHRRTSDDGQSIVWMAEPGRERDFVFVFLPGGPDRPRHPRDYGHIGFALDSRDAVDAMAERGRGAGCLLWEPVEHSWPTGYFCGLADPDGHAVEFSFGQPLGPGASQFPET